MVREFGEKSVVLELTVITAANSMEDRFSTREALRLQG